MRTIPSCRLAASIDLRVAEALDIRTVAPAPAGLGEHIASLASDLMIGPRSKAVTRPVLPYLDLGADDVDPAGDITIETEASQYVFVRRGDGSDQAVVVIGARAQPIGQTLATLRMTLARRSG
jgi:hypothetical protein